MAGSDSRFDSSVSSNSEVGSKSEVGSESESTVGPGSTLSTGSLLGMQADSDSSHSVTEEFFLPAILQSTEGNLQHYDRWLHSMCTEHEGTPSGNAQIPHRYSTGLIHDLVLLRSQILLLDL